MKKCSTSTSLNDVADAIRNHNDPAIFIVLGEGNAKVRLAVIEVELLEQLTEGE